MSARQPLDLLPKVRTYVLEQAALGNTTIALSMITYAVDRPLTLGNPQADKRVHFANRWFTNSTLKAPSKWGHRGHVQTCLSELAKSGLMWTRQKPEPGRFRGERCDKWFRIRISKDDAIAQLRKDGRKVPVREEGWSAHWKPSLGQQASIKWIA
jgi:hypothetical protein